MEFSPSNAMAMFRCLGFEVTNALVKAHDGIHGYRVDAALSIEQAPDLHSLPCRWSPMASENGVIVSLIVAVRDTDMLRADKVYRGVLSCLDRITTLDSEHTSPVQLFKLRARIRFSSMPKAVKTLSGPLCQRWLRVLTQHLLQTLVFWLSLRTGGFDSQQYEREITVNADFRKVSGMLRMILDCTKQQAD
jgi:hypothetical protein